MKNIFFILVLLFFSTEVVFAGQTVKVATMVPRTPVINIASSSGTGDVDGTHIILADPATYNFDQSRPFDVILGGQSFDTNPQHLQYLVTGIKITSSVDKDVDNKGFTIHASGSYISNGTAYPTINNMVTWIAIQKD